MADRLIRLTDDTHYTETVLYNVDGGQRLVNTATGTANEVGCYISWVEEK